MFCQRQSVLQRELHTKYYHRCCNPGSAIAIYLEIAASSSSEAGSEQYLCAWCLVSLQSYLQIARTPTDPWISVICVSITRFTFIIKLDLMSPDVTWNFVNTQLWTAVESHIAITCGKSQTQSSPKKLFDVTQAQCVACLPSLRPILNLVLFGSVNPPDGKDARNGSASKQYKGSYSWDSHVRRKKWHNKLGSFATAEQGEHGFMELTDRAQHNIQTDTLPAPQSTLDIENGIHVRTEFSVEG